MEGSAGCDMCGVFEKQGFGKERPFARMGVSNFLKAHGVRKMRTKRMQSLLPRITLMVILIGSTFVYSQIRTSDGAHPSTEYRSPRSQVAAESSVVLRRLLELDSSNDFAGENPTENATGPEEETEKRNCTSPSIHEFPHDLFTDEQRLQGALIVHFFVCFYMFVALAIVCDDYFVPSLEQISEKLKLTEDVAGATFMAAGSSAPELFTSVIGVFVAHGDVGIGTIVGSAVFNILVIIGLCALLCSEDVPLHWWPLTRDSSYYGIAIAVLIAVIHDSSVTWYESLIMLILYVGYIIVMKFNNSLEKLLTVARRKTVGKLRGKKKESKDDEKDEMSSQNLDRMDVESNSASEKSPDATEMKLIGGEADKRDNKPDPITKANRNAKENETLLSKTNGSSSSSPLDKKPLCASQNGMSVVAQLAPRPQTLLPIDEVISGGNRPIRFDEAGLRLMMSSTFAPKTRLRMACKILINERQNLVVEKNKDDGAPQRVLVRRKTDLSLDGVASTPAISERAVSDAAEDVKSVSVTNPDEELSSFTHPFIIPRDSCVRFLKWVSCWPISFLFFVTIPNCSKKRWENWYMVSFLMSIGWIVVCSYIMVWMGTICGYTLNIPDSIMGITFLAAGTSVPDTIASVIVARQGLGDMAVSNSIGSNVFDILLGLALPWFLKTANGTTVQINSKGLLFSVLLLLGSLFFVIVSIHVNGWKLTRKFGILILLLYAVFLTLSILIEFNVFFPVNSPMCRE